MQKFLGTAVALAAFAGACKPAKTNTAGVKSLDDLVAGTSGKNVCSGSYAANVFPAAQIKGSDEMKAIVTQSLTAIPGPVLTSLASQGLSIKVSKDTAKICSGAAGSYVPPGVKGQMKACWSLAPEGVTINIEENAKTVADLTVKQFMEVWFEVTLNSNVVKEQFQLQSIDGADKLEMKRQLTLAFLQDITAQKQITGSRLAAIFGPELARATVGDRDKVWGGLGAPRQASIGRTVLVEASHQYFCNDKTRAAFAKYPNAAQVFNDQILGPMNTVWGKDYGVKLVGIPVTGGGPKGLGLRAAFPLLRGAARVVTAPFRAGAAIIGARQDARGALEEQGRPIAAALAPFPALAASRGRVFGGGSCPFSRGAGLALTEGPEAGGDGGEGECADCVAAAAGGASEIDQRSTEAGSPPPEGGDAGAAPEAPVPAEGTPQPEAVTPEAAPAIEQIEPEAPTPTTETEPEE